MRYHADPYRLFLFMGAVWSFSSSMAFTILAVYFVQEVGMTPFQLVLVGTTMEVAYFLFEVPTGIVADAYSRKLSIILAYLLLGAGLIVEGLVPVFGIILMAEVIRAIGYTFESGALQAWLADEIGEARVGPTLLRSGQLMQLVRFGGIAAGVGLATLQLNIPIVASGVLLILLAILLWFVMPEEGFKPAPRQGFKPPWASMGETLRTSVRAMRLNQTVLMFFVIEIFSGSFSEGLDRLWEAHFLQNFQFPTVVSWEPVIWFGIINAGSGILNIFLAEAIRRRVDMTNHRQMAKILLLSNSAIIAGAVLFGLSRQFGLALIAFWIVGVSRSIGGPLIGAWLNQSIPSKNRATLLSLVGQGNALGQIGGGPAVGWLGTVRSLRTAMVASGLLLTPTVALYARFGWRDADPSSSREDSPLHPES